MHRGGGLCTGGAGNAREVVPSQGGVPVHRHPPLCTGWGAGAEGGVPVQSGESVCFNGEAARRRGNVQARVAVRNGGRRGATGRRRAGLRGGAAIRSLRWRRRTWCRLLQRHRMQLIAAGAGVDSLGGGGCRRARRTRCRTPPSGRAAAAARRGKSPPTPGPTHPGTCRQCSAQRARLARGQDE